MLTEVNDPIEVIQFNFFNTLIILFSYLFVSFRFTYVKFKKIIFIYKIHRWMKLFDYKHIIPIKKNKFYLKYICIQIYGLNIFFNRIIQKKQTTLLKASFWSSNMKVSLFHRFFVHFAISGNELKWLRILWVIFFM